jgi:nucleotide-binding universal stress UspA family protein
MSTRLSIAYDGSPSAATAVRVAAGLFPEGRAAIVTVPPAAPVGVTGASRWMVNVGTEVVQQALDEISAEADQQAHATAAEGVKRAGSAGLEAEPVVARPHAPTWEALLMTAHDQQADALVCGARGRSGFARTLLGSTSTSLLHHADLPLVVVPDGAGTLDGPVVIAYDGSEPARNAIEVTGRLLSGSTAIVVHIWESQYRHSLALQTLASTPGEDVQQIIDMLDNALADAAATTTEEGVALAQEAGLDANGETVEATAGVWRTIASLARTHDAALIATGARGIGGARSALLGSVSSGLIHNAELPILIAQTTP